MVRWCTRIASPFASSSSEERPHVPGTLLSRSHTEYVATESLVQMMMIEEILAEEEEHADDLADLLKGLPEDLKH